VETAEAKRYRLLGAEGGKGMSVLRDNRETGLVTVIAAERDCRTILTVAAYAWK
jgi:hypothetical protein